MRTFINVVWNKADNPENPREKWPETMSKLPCQVDEPDVVVLLQHHQPGAGVVQHHVVGLGEPRWPCRTVCGGV